MYTVLIEWDGTKPPTTFYSRLKKIGITAAKWDDSEKRLSPLFRRASRGYSITDPDYLPENVAVVFQEGAIICQTESCARTIQGLAVEYGAKTVMQLHGIPVEYHMTVEDARTLARIGGQLGRRGRPPAAEKSPWLVTCHEEANLYLTEEASFVTVCPSCKGTRFNARRGSVIPAYQYPNTGDPIEDWVRHRFATGAFEVAEVVGSPLPDETPVINSGDEERVVRTIRNSPALVRAVKSMTRQEAARILDGVFCARCYISPEARKDARIEAAVAVMQKGFQTSVLEKPDEYDVLDCAAVRGFGSKVASAAFIEAARASS